MRDQSREAAQDSIRSAFLVIAETLERLEVEATQLRVAGSGAGNETSTGDEA